MNKLSNNELLNMLDKLKIPSTSTELKTALRDRHKRSLKEIERHSVSG